MTYIQYTQIQICLGFLEEENDEKKRAGYVELIRKILYNEELQSAANTDNTVYAKRYILFNGEG